MVPLPALRDTPPTYRPTSAPSTEPGRRSTRGRPGRDGHGCDELPDLPLADRDRARDGDAAEKRVRAWAGAEDEPNQKYRDAHVWYDADKSLTRTSC